MDIQDIIEGISPLQFRVVRQLPTVGEPGTIYVQGVNEYIYVDSVWTQIACASDAVSVPEVVKIERPHITNCKNCGAVLEGHKCKYCGTQY